MESRTYFFDKITGQKIVVDWRDARPGDKQYHWEQRGVPLRIGDRPARCRRPELMVLKRRLDREKLIGFARRDVAPIGCETKLDADSGRDVRKSAGVSRAEHPRRDQLRRNEKDSRRDTADSCRAWFKPDRAAESKIKEQTKATVRCILLEGQSGNRQVHFHRRETDTRSAIRAGVLIQSV